MALNDKYDAFYKTDGKARSITDYAIRKWPLNRAEAIVAVDGTGDSIMDVGCGDGSLLWQFRNRYRNLVGLEYSPERLKQAEANLRGLSFTPVLGSAEDLSMLKDNSIDRIVSADVIEHIPDVYVAAQELFRVLRPGGWLVINTPNIAFIKKRVLLALGRFPSTSQPNEGLGSDVLFDGGHLHYFTFRSLRLLLERAGFEMVRPMGFGKLGAFHSVWPALASGGVQWVARKPD